MKASELLEVKEFIPTGFATLNTILGGGVPLKKITEISGTYSVGKSTVALQIVSEAQKLGMDTLWCDTEFSLDVEYAKGLGVVPHNLEVVRERFAEDALDSVEKWAEEHKGALIVIDSIGGLLPRAEAEKGSGEKTIGGQAKLIATFCRKIVPILHSHKIALIVLNHEFVDLMSSKLKTSGGAKLEYAKSIWVRLRKKNERLMQSGQQIGDVIEAEIRKNKVASTMRQTCELELIYGAGFNREKDLMEEAIEKGIITKSGQFFMLNGERIARGQAALREWFKNEENVTLVKNVLPSPLQEQ